jgi:hypothetical protein
MGVVGGAPTHPYPPGSNADQALRAASNSFYTMAGFAMLGVLIDLHLLPLDTGLTTAHGGAGTVLLVADVFVGLASLPIAWRLRQGRASARTAGLLLCITVLTFTVFFYATQQRPMLVFPAMLGAVLNLARLLDPATARVFRKALPPGASGPGGGWGIGRPPSGSTPPSRPQPRPGDRRSPQARMPQTRRGGRGRGPGEGAGGRSDM